MTATALRLPAVLPAASKFVRAGISAGNCTGNPVGNPAGHRAGNSAGNSAANSAGRGRAAATGRCAPEGAAPQLAIVVLAREAAALRCTLRGLAMETAWDGRCTVLVAAGDADASVLARQAGAQVLPVPLPMVRQDGADMVLDAVLRSAAQQLPAATGWVLVVQAGSDLAPGFLDALRGAMADAASAGGGVDALQCRLGRHGAAALPTAARARLGHNGFALSRAALLHLVSLGPAVCAAWRVRGVDGALLLDDGAHAQARAPWAARAPLLSRALHALRAAVQRPRDLAWRGARRAA